MRSWVRLGGWAAGALVLLAPAARAADDAAIRQAIQRGVTYLKGLQERSTGIWPFVDEDGGPGPRPGGGRRPPFGGGGPGPRVAPNQARIGATALAGLTLLECDVPDDDPAIRKAADAVRRASVGLTDTYSVSLAILFLDRLGDPGDKVLIESLAVRLLAGQNSTGGWTYQCPPISQEETARLTAYVRKRTQQAKGQPASGSGRANPDKAKISVEIQQQLRLINPNRLGMPRYSDNSNTKFATLALWVARRHGMPVEQALQMVENRFRGSQNADGGWGYLPGRGGRGDLQESVGSMTCAGLLGLAIGHGVSQVTMHTGRGGAAAAPGQAPPRDLTQDPAIRAGFRFLGIIMSQPIGKVGGDQPPLSGPKGDEYYSLWAIERVGVAYDLRTIGDQDWYSWGAEFLLGQQDTTGGWTHVGEPTNVGRQGHRYRSRYAAGGVDTCFALLFLRQANLSRDLTVSLTGRAPDPGNANREARGPAKPARPEAKPPQEPAPRDEAARPARPEPAREKGTPPPAPPATPKESDLEVEAERLGSELVKASPTRQRELLDQFKESKGVVYTQALAAAIPLLKGSAQRQAREVLAERLMRMTAATLRGRLKDDDPEMRRAAAIACALKEDRALVPDLIATLDDSEPLVWRAAAIALHSLTGKDFGPAPGASPAEKAAAVTTWKTWWERQPRR
jgi:hypothetical protein